MIQNIISKQLSAISALSDYASHVLEPLRLHPYIGDIRIEGLMIGIECVKDHSTKEPYSTMVADILQKCLDRQLIVLSCGVHLSLIHI